MSSYSVSSASLLCKAACSFLLLLLVHSAFAITVPNAGFEDPGRTISGWSFATGEGGIGAWSFDTERVHAGARALKLRMDNASGYVLLTSGRIPVNEDTDYEVHAWVSTYGRSFANVKLMLRQTGSATVPNAASVSKPMVTGDGWQQISAGVHVEKGNTFLQISAIVAGAPAEVSWDDFEIVEKSGVGQYAPRYEAPAIETVPSLESVRAAVAARPQATVRTETRDGRTRFLLDGKPMPPNFYIGPFRNLLSGAWISDFAQTGVHVYGLPLVLGKDTYPGTLGVWSGANHYDWTDLDNLLWRALRVDPQGYLVLYLEVDPYRDWGREHPDDVVKDQNGNPVIADMYPRKWGGEPTGIQRFAPSLYSATLRDETTRTLREMVKHIQSIAPGKAVIGYHVCGFVDGQFFQFAVNYGKDPHLADYSDAAHRAFRAWLRRQYNGDVAALQHAWRQPGVTFESADIPAGERRLGAGFFLNAQTDQDIADYNRFYSEGIIDTVTSYAHTLKEATGGTALIGTYYEDSPAALDCHVALGRLLECKDIDYLACPAAYGVRLPGEPGECHTTWTSVTQHNKIMISEQDWRSWHVQSNGQQLDHEWGRAATSDEFAAMVRRESGMMLAFGQGTWWYDKGGWFHGQELMQPISEAHAVFERDLTLPGAPRTEVAVFIDERSQDYLGLLPSYLYRRQGIMNQIFTLNESGVPYHLYLQQDLTQANLPDYKVYLFLDAYHLSPAERQALLALRRDGKTLVFVHAPNVMPPTPGDTPADPATAIQDITGMKVRALSANMLLSVSPVNSRSPLTQKIDTIMSTAGLTGPAFAVVDPQATALGRYATGETAVASRDFGAWKSVFFGGIGMPDQFISNIAAWAGAWRAAEPGDAVYASQYYATIHAITPGRKQLILLYPSKVTDLTTGKVFADNTRQITVDMATGDTRWFSLTPLQVGAMPAPPSTLEAEKEKKPLTTPQGKLHRKR